MSLRNAVERHWAGEPSFPGLGAALHLGEFAYRAVSGARNALYDSGLLPTATGPIPVISVGNLTVGGTGKTPVVRWIVRTLQEAGHKPAVVLRGYGGDETLLHRRWYPDVPVVEAPIRLHGVREASEAGANVVVCDDAFQHRRLTRDLDIVLVSADDTRPVHLLPAGPYRELPSALGRADVILVVTKGEQAAMTESMASGLNLPAGLPTHPIMLAGAGWTRLDGASCPAPVGSVLVVTGVGAPRTVERLVARAIEADVALGHVELLAFPDHHAYTPADLTCILAQAGSRSIVTTEKDAVKLQAYNHLYDRTWVVGMDVSSVENENSLRERLVGVADG